MSHTRGKILVWIIKSQNRSARVCLQKIKRKEKKCEPSGVISEAGSVHRLTAGGLCIATERSPDLQTSF